MLGTKTMIVLNSAEVVKELLDKKSAITSARPDLYFGQTLMSGGKRMVMMVCTSIYHSPFLFGGYVGGGMGNGIAD
jgi:hypothetical protein